MALLGDVPAQLFAAAVDRPRGLWSSSLLCCDVTSTVFGLSTYKGQLREHVSNITIRLDGDPKTIGVHDTDLLVCRDTSVGVHRGFSRRLASLVASSSWSAVPGQSQNDLLHDLYVSVPCTWLLSCVYKRLRRSTVFVGGCIVTASENDGRAYVGNWHSAVADAVGRGSRVSRPVEPIMAPAPPTLTEHSSLIAVYALRLPCDALPLLLSLHTSASRGTRLLYFDPTRRRLEGQDNDGWRSARTVEGFNGRCLLAVPVFSRARPPSDSEVFAASVSGHGVAYRFRLRDPEVSHADLASHQSCMHEPLILRLPLSLTELIADYVFAPAIPRLVC